ncbi:DUF2085 domain-containing protein [Clostridium senegalense]|uniref:DUF2085 domain-containing protein n=1 Tax=Clostridium senegalense TaxID=1465809 RepID=UPI001C120BF2|nr:DUF2085 domain-containing protein [Clostridium senegalense]MBU5227519.1 DUF2085 domain-containing protein [Clostridium senegalense]
MEKILKYMFFCHRMPERSFFLKNKQFPICARCTGILVGYFIGIIYSILTKKINFFLLFIFMIPISIDGIGQLYGYWNSNNIRRFLTGILAGIATIQFIHIAIILGLRSGNMVQNYLNKI